MELSGKNAEKNLKMTKVSMIAQEVGQCPVLSFGNSAGDMLHCLFRRSAAHVWKIPHNMGGSLTDDNQSSAA